MILIHSEKNFQTLENQIRILKAKGLVIQNPSVAKKWLSQCNYYNLINGYKELFLDYKRINEDPHHHEVFKLNTTIEELKPSMILTLNYEYSPLNTFSSLNENLNTTLLITSNNFINHLMPIYMPKATINIKSKK